MSQIQDRGCPFGRRICWTPSRAGGGFQGAGHSLIGDSGGDNSLNPSSPTPSNLPQVQLCAAPLPVIKQNSWNNFSHPHTAGWRGRDGADVAGAVSPTPPGRAVPPIVPCSPR